MLQMIGILILYPLKDCRLLLNFRNIYCICCFVLCRGIDVVRNKIKMFAQKKVTLPSGRHKIVILDEADR